MKVYLIVEVLVALALLACVFVETGVFTTLCFSMVFVYLEREALDLGYRGIVAQLLKK